MSTKPSSVATWDSGSVNLSAPTGGHIASGFASGEVPTSAEMNGWRQIVGAWTQYLSDASFTGGVTIAGGLTVDVVHTSLTRLACYADMQTTSTGPTVATGTAVGWVVGTSTGRLYVPLKVNAGETITAWHLFVAKVSASGTISAQLASFDANAGGETLIGTAFTQSTTSSYLQMAKTGLSTVATSTAQYYLVFTGGGTTGDFVYSGSVTVST